jgi:hypothetical protein
MLRFCIETIFVEIQKLRNSKTQKFKNSEIQKNRTPKLQKNSEVLRF